MEQRTIITIKKQLYPTSYQHLIFLLRARDKHPDQFHIPCSLLHAELDHLVCTDSKRLHKIENNFSLPPGNYVILKHTKSETILAVTNDDYPDFPHYKALIHPNPQYTASIQTIRSNSIAHFLYHLYKTFDVPINPDYIKDLGNDDYQLSRPVEDKAIYFKSENRFALILPMKKE